jgi:hypothetical protein
VPRRKELPAVKDLADLPQIANCGISEAALTEAGLSLHKLLSA